MELRRGKWSVFNSREESLPMCCPREQVAAWVAIVSGIQFHVRAAYECTKQKRWDSIPGEKRGALRNLHRVPSHVGGNTSPPTGRRPLAIGRTRGIDAMFDSVIEQHLHPHTNAEHGSTTGQSLIDELRAIDIAGAPACRRVGPNAGNDEPIGQIAPADPTSPQRSRRPSPARAERIADFPTHSRARQCSANS